MQKFKRIFFLVLLLLLIIFVYVGNIGKIELSIDQSLSNDTVGGISDGIEIEQSFYSSVNNISGFSIKFGTYMRENSGDIVIGIKRAKTRKIIYSTTVKAKSIVDNAYFDYRFPPITVSKGKEYILFIKSNGSPVDKSITVYKSSKDHYKDGSLFQNGVRMDGDLVFRVVYNKTLF